MKTLGGAAAVLLFLAAGGLAGCGEDSEPAAATHEVVQVAAVERPIDATPSPDGEQIYFVTEAALYRAADGAPVKLADVAGASSVVALDDTIFVGTTQGVLAVPVAGGPPTPVSGTEGLSVRMIDITDRLVVAAWAAGVGEGVFEVPFTGGQLERVVADLPARSTGILALADGAYVVALADGQLMRAQGEVAEIIFEYEDIGSPAGLALAPDGRLMISSLSAEGTAQVVLLDLQTGATDVFNEGIGANTGAAGLHQAEGAPTYAWADSSDSGGVYRFRLRF